MRMVQAAGLLFVLVTGVQVAPHFASAETLSSTQIIKVTATVAPQRYALVDPADHAKLIKIISNTKQAVTPEVIIGKIAAESIPLTPALLATYQATLKQNPDFGIGELKVSTGIMKKSPSNNRVNHAVTIAGRSLSFGQLLATRQANQI